MRRGDLPPFHFYNEHTRHRLRFYRFVNYLNLLNLKLQEQVNKVSYLLQNIAAFENKFKSFIS